MQSVVVIGATNRPNLIDPALLRPGRLDELIYVAVPDKQGRRRILEIQTGKMPLAKDVDLGVLAESSNRFPGAHLEDLKPRPGPAALQHSMRSENVALEACETALKDRGASVTEAMERDYEKIQGENKQAAMSVDPLGLFAPGMLKPVRERKHDDTSD